jgi:hypothetical protein
MTLQDRIEAFHKLGIYLNAIDEAGLLEIASSARNQNSWFTKESVQLAFRGISRFLKKETLENWTSRYVMPSQSKIVAVVMAGNVPLVGFHDFLSVLICGHTIMIKLSSKDTVLMTHVINKLIELEPRFEKRIIIVEQLKNFDAVISTGSDNSARYFEFYFSKYPHIIRKNRTSCAILTGFETDDELVLLGNDVFTYFGLGCRNVSKLYIPRGFDLPRLLSLWEPYSTVVLHHHKYHNNYDYQKSLLLVNRMPFLDAGYLLLQENEKLISPISVLFYEYYDDWESLLKILEEQKNKLQCIVGNVEHATVKIGQAQSPAVDDYADQVDTLNFLTSLS